MSIYGHGPTVREQQILDLHDAKVAPADIAAKLEVKQSYVKYVIDSLYLPKLVDWQNPAREASGDLVAALRRHHPERCGA
jgi:DNA-binding MarR family transcriptional regulator